MRKFLTAMILLALLVVAGVAGWRWAADAPQRAVASLMDRLRAQYRDEVSLFLEVNGIARRAELVLAQVDMTVTGAYASEKEWMGIDLGETSLQYTVPVRYLYGVDLSAEHPIDFTLQVEAGVLEVAFPPLMLVSVEADLGKLVKEVEVGWARSARHSGRDVERRFRERVMDDLRAKGRGVSNRVLGERDARAQLETLVRRYLEQAHPEASAAIREIRIRFGGNLVPAVRSGGG